MNRNELDREIKKGIQANSFLFFGESFFLVDYYTKIIANDTDALVLKLYFDEYNFETAKAHLSQSSLFGDKNILIIKTQKRVPKKELDILFDISDKNQNNIFIYAYYGDEYSAYAKTYEKRKTMDVRFFHPKPSEAAQIVASHARDLNLNIDNHAIVHLLNIQNNNLSLTCNELEKLKIYDRAISQKDIDMLVFGLAEVSVEVVVEKILEKKEFLDDLQNLLNHGEDEIQIMLFIVRYMTQLYLFRIYTMVNGAPDGLAILGYKAPNFVVEQKARQSQKIKLQAYKKIQELLLESELKMKSSHIDKSAILFSALIRVQKIINS